MKRLLPLAALLLAAAAAAQAPAAWTEPVEPFRIAGNIHYVGTADLAAYLIATPAGHILLDAPLEENVPQILASIEKLGFEPKDVKVLINSHAHGDHAGGFAAIRERTGARLLLSAADAELAARGGRDDFAFGDTIVYPPVRADGPVVDGTEIVLGGTILTAVLTPGHTKGGTSWTMTVEENGEPLRVVFANSMTAPGYRLVDNPKYPGIIEDYRASFEKLRALEADVFLGPHGSFFRLREKIARLGGAENPFIDPAALDRYIDRMSRAVERQYREQAAETD